MAGNAIFYELGHIHNLTIFHELANIRGMNSEWKGLPFHSANTTLDEIPARRHKSHHGIANNESRIPTKQSCKAILIFGLFLALSTGTLFAQPSTNIYNLDEYGNGYLQVTATPNFVYELSFDAAPDPSGGVTNSPVLIYYLYDQVVLGDVALIGTNQSVTKLLRFVTDTSGYGDVIFYSQADGTPAGTGIPLSTNSIQINETGPITTWYPAATNQPGYSASIAVPEGFAGIEYCIHTACPVQPPCLSGTNLIWNYTTGVPGASVVVMASTNLSLSITNWDRISTNKFDYSGSCLLTLPVQPGKPCLFYRIGWTAHIIPTN